MKSPSAQPDDGPPIFSVCLLAAGLACLFVAVWLSTVDFAALISQRIAQARGAMSPETSAWLHALDPRNFFLWASAALGLAGGAAFYFRHRFTRWLTAVTNVSQETALAPASLRWITAVSALAVLARYFPTLRHGFFRYDDFDLVSIAHDYRWWETLPMLHGDHFMPLTRVLASLGVACFGVTAWPYNLGILLCMWGVIAMGCAVLAELGASRVAQLLFVALLALWSPWAELMAGYYILSSYLLIAGLGLIAVWCYRRWRTGAGKIHAVAAVASVTAATLVDISGWYVPPALGVFFAADFAENIRTEGWRAWLTKHRALLGILALSVGASLAWTVYVYAVLNRGAFLGMGEGGTRTLTRLAADFAYLFDVGLLVSLAVPYVYARLPTALLAALSVAALAVWIVFIVAAVRAASRRQKIFLAALATVLAGACLMVNLGRPSSDTIMVRWAAKHVGPAYVWLCLLLVVGWQALWTKTSGRRRAIMAEVSLVFLGAFWAAQTAFGALGLAVAFPPFGYPAEIRDAITRRAAIAELRHTLIEPIARNVGPSAKVPALEGSQIAARHPSLFDYNLTRYQPFFGEAANAITFVRNPAMQRWGSRSVETVPILRDAVSPAFVELLRSDAHVRGYYLEAFTPQVLSQRSRSTDRVPLTVRAVGCELGREPDGSAIVESSQPIKFVVRDSLFETETLPCLRFAAERIDAPPGGEILIAVEFMCEFTGVMRTQTFAVRTAVDHIAVIDLRQSAAFALSRVALNLRVVLVQPGRYRLRVLDLGP